MSAALPTKKKGGSVTTGGLKGLLQRGGTWAYETGVYTRDKGSESLKWIVKKGGNLAFALATTSMIVLMPLLFEIAREGQVRAFFRIRVLSAGPWV